MGGIKKEYRQLPVRAGEEPLTVLGSVVRAFAASGRVGMIVIAVPVGGEAAARESLPPESKAALKRGEKNILFAEGGPSRQRSVYNALCFLESLHPSLVLIHDGARPWIKTSLIEAVIDAAEAHRAAIPLLPLVETPKEVDFQGSESIGFITRHLRRSRVGTAQTPQGFSFSELLEAHRKAALDGKTEYTDDAEIWGAFAGKVAVVPGDPLNKKITFPEDIETP